ncbi:hypothetical protein GGI42DRAFT_15618 [Trichoderma sp. SZMC 28013]
MMRLLWNGVDSCGRLQPRWFLTLMLLGDLGMHALSAENGEPEVPLLEPWRILRGCAGTATTTSTPFCSGRQLPKYLHAAPAQEWLC